jgi:hypothetical protein
MIGRVTQFSLLSMPGEPQRAVALLPELLTRRTTTAIRCQATTLVMTTYR